MRLWLLICALFAALPAQAARLVIQADTQVLREGQSTQLHVTLVDGDALQIPDMPSLEGLSFNYQGQQQSTSMVNFKTTRNNTWTFRMTGLKEGRWELGPLRLPTKQGVLSSNAIILRVQERDRVSKEAEGASASLQPEELWVGEVAVYSLRFRSPRPVLDMGWTPPEFKGFVPEQRTEGVQREYELQEGEVLLKMLEIDIPLVATAPGARTLDPAVLQVQFPSQQRRRRRSILQGFYQTRTEAFATKPLDITVRPLPEQGKSDAWSGLVGSFRLHSELSADSVSLGESVTWTLSIEGDGTLVGFRFPEMEEAPGFRVYDDQPKLSGGMEEGQFQQRMELKRALVPEEEGSLLVPALRLQVFDPESARYLELATEEQRLEVVAGANLSKVQSFSAEETAASTSPEPQLMPLRVSPGRRSQMLGWRDPLLWGLGLIPLVICPLQFAVGRLRARPRAADRPRWKRMLRELNEEDPAAVESLLRQLLAAQLGISPGGVSQARVQDSTLSAELKVRVLELYRALEEARYGGGGMPEQVQSSVRPLLRSLMELR